jgi:hypothetical protein
VVREIRGWISTHAELVARFAPSDRDRDRDDQRFFLMHDSPDSEDVEACWAWRGMRVQRLGKVVEIYRLPR